MKVICAWCGKFLRYKKGGEKGDVSHGICKCCSQEVLKGASYA